MSGKDYGIESIRDAFLALNEVDEDIEIPTNAKRKGLKEAASVDVRNSEDVELAQDFRKNDKKEEDSELEVIDVDADSIENLQDGKSYIGKMLLQCNSCRSTRFIDIDKLVQDEIIIGTDAHKYDELTDNLKIAEQVVTELNLKPVIYQKRKRIIL